MARVTLLVPCRNAGAHLVPCLDSLLGQTEADAGLVLVDDGSSDGSAALARARGGDRLTVIENGVQLGIGANWNRCAALVDTPYFGLAHMDDVYDRTWARTLVDALERRPGAGAAHCVARAIDVDGRPVDAAEERYKLHFWRGLEHASRAEAFRRLLRGNFVSCPTVIWRTDVFRKTGGFDEQLRFALDWKASFSLLLAGAELVGVPRALVRYRRHAASATIELRRSFERYREEAEVAAWALAAGVEAGIVPPATRPSRAARNHLLHDVLRDLQAGDREAARAKLRFARDELATAARDPMVALVGAAERAGVAGRAALRFGLAALLALRAPRRHSM